MKVKAQIYRTEANQELPVLEVTTNGCFIMNKEVKWVKYLHIHFKGSTVPFISIIYHFHLIKKKGKTRRKEDWSNHQRNSQEKSFLYLIRFPGTIKYKRKDSQSKIKKAVFELKKLS